MSPTRQRIWLPAAALPVALLMLATPTAAQFDPCQPMPLGGTFTIGQDVPAQSGAQYTPDAAMFANGQSIVAYEQLGSLGSDRDRLSVHARRISATGQPMGNSFQVNTVTTEDQYDVAVAVAPNGAFAMTWTSDVSPGDMDGTSIRARAYSANGTPKGPDFQVNNVTGAHQARPRIAMNNQQIVVVWDSQGSSAGNDNQSNSVQARRFNLNGVPLGGQFQVNTVIESFQWEPDVAMHPDGRTVIVWESARSAGDDRNGHSIQVRRYSAAGAPLSAERQLNTVTQGSAQTPRVEMDFTNASFLTVWSNGTSAGNDNDRSSIQGRGMQWSGIATSQNDFQVNRVIASSQFRPNLANVGPKEYSVVWATGPSGSVTLAIRSVTLEGDGLGNELNVSGSALRPQDVAIAANGGGTSLAVYKHAAVQGLGDGIVGRRYNHPCATGQPPGCVETPTTLCLTDDRFRVTVQWRNRAGASGAGQAVKLTPDTGYFWFFNRENVEMVIKVLNACVINQRFWVFAGGLTDVKVDVEVYDTEADISLPYGNPLGTPFQPIQDTNAFATCP